MKQSGGEMRKNGVDRRFKNRYNTNKSGGELEKNSVHRQFER